MVHVDIRGAIETLQRKFEQRLTQSEIDRAIARAINHTLAKAKTEVKRGISKKYKIDQKDVAKTLKQVGASASWLEGKITISGRPLPLMAFNPQIVGESYKQSGTGWVGLFKKVGGGVSVNIKGEEKTVQKAFVRKLKSGHVGVFARGYYAAGKFVFSKPRLPITELKTLSIPVAASQNIVIDAVSKKMQQNFPARLEHELLHLIRTTR